MTESTLSAQNTLLVVDDENVGRYSKVRILRQAGYDVFEAVNAADAFRLIQEVRPRLVVLDIHLPDMDGREVCRRLKSDPATASIPVLQVSATFVSGPDTVRALEAGADGCLTEPIEPPVLVATVKALLRARQAEEDLRLALARELEARQIADAANRMKDEFLAMLSHELRSPLGAILTWVTLLQDDRVDARQRERAHQAIERNARLQVKLIEDLLDVSSIVTGKLRLELAPVSLATVVENAVESVRPVADAKGICLELVHDPEPKPLLADSHRLQQVVSNLLSNAVKFTPRGGRVDVRVANSDSTAEVLIRDTGRGISPEFLPHIFERFRQADSSPTRSEGGLGLGLAIVRHLVALHGGSVEAESPGKGQGSTFRLRFPLPAEPIALGPPPPARGRHGMLPTLEGVRVLIVDDEPDSREVVTAVLERSGADVIAVASVADALAEIDQAFPDVLVSDIAMPAEDGFSLIRRVRARPIESGGGIPAMALTAYATPEDEARTLDAGYHAYLKKPVDATDLIVTVARLSARSPLLS